jgi:hypothetical protein
MICRPEVFKAVADCESENSVEGLLLRFPAFMMEEIIDGMMDGNPELTVQQMEESLSAEREAERPLTQRKSGLTPALCAPRII